MNPRLFLFVGFEELQKEGKRGRGKRGKNGSKNICGREMDKLIACSHSIEKSIENFVFGL